MSAESDFRFGFRVLGDCRQPRRLVDADAALQGYAACDPQAEVDREAYLSAFQFAGDFREHLTATGSTAGFSGPCWAAWLWFDIDRENDLPAALHDTRRSCTATADGLGIAEDDLLLFLSGGKGFHLGIPTSTWGPTPGPNFHKTARRFAERLAERAGVAIDTGVYDKVRCFRAPNSKHPRTGLHKRRLSAGELMNWTANAILTHASKPAEFALPCPTYTTPGAVALWAEAAQLVASEANARAGRVAVGNGAATLNKLTLAFIRDGADKGDRHRLTYSAAANLGELGAPLAPAVALLTEAALDSGLPPADARRAIENGWHSVQPDVRPACEVFGGAVVAVEPAGGAG